MNKKATISFNQMYYVVRLFFLMIIVFFIFNTINSHLQTEIDIFDVESSLIMQRFFFDSNSFSYIDEDTGRQYVGIVDKEKFTKEHYDKFLSKGVYSDSKNPHISGKLTLKEVSGEETSIVYNQEQYDMWRPLAKSNAKGIGGARINAKQFYVLIKDDELEQGILEIEIIIPNS